MGQKIDYSTLDSIELSINHKPYKLLIMKSEEEKEYGAQGITELEEGEGFFFDYREDPGQDLVFWMKDTDIPLTIAFVDNDDIVTSVYKGKPNDETYLEGKNVSYVIEVSAEDDIKVGDEIEIEDTEPISDFPNNSMFVLNDDGTIQFTLEGNERIFSRHSTKVIIRKAKRAFKSNSETDYKDLGRYIFKELQAQTDRPEQFVETP